MANTKTTDGAEGTLDFTSKLVILSSGLLSALCLTAINSVLPSIARALAHGPGDAMLVKQLIGAVALAMAAGAPLGGYLADRIGLRPTLFAASVLYTVAGTAGLYLNSLPLLLVSRLLLGLAAASIQVLGLTMINTTLKGNARARWMGLHISVAIFGTLFIHPLAGQLGEISWRLPFALYAGGAILVLGLLLSRGSSVAKAQSTIAAATATAAAGAGPGIISWFPWHYVPLSLVIGAMTFLPTISIPFQLKEQAGATPSTIAYVLTGTSAIGAIMAFFYGPARRHLSAHAAFLIGFGLAGTGALIAANSSSFGGVLSGLFIHSMGAAWFAPNIMTALGSKVTQEQQGRAAGLVKAAHFLAAPLAVTLVQPFVKQYGEVIAMQAVAVIGLGMFAIMALRMVSAVGPGRVGA
jgi:MFS family permease